MDTSSPLFLALDLAGVFAFALNGALTAVRVARLDVVGVVTLGGAALCFVIRMLGLRFGIDAPRPRGVLPPAGDGSGPEA